VSDELKVYTKKETQKLLGLSGRTWDRLEALGETPPKTRLSPNRIGYRASDISAWLDARREPQPSAKEMLDAKPEGDNWQRLGEPVVKVVCNTASARGRR
jgi:predicted DNA-binding transcriptional regulator AlpA